MDMSGRKPAKQYQIIKPLIDGDVYAEWQNCLEQLKTLTNQSVIKVSVFVNERYWEEAFIDFTSELLDIFPNGCPAFTFLAQAPGKNNITLEVIFLNNSSATISYKTYQNIPYSLIECNDYREVWAAGLGLLSKLQTVSESASRAFEQMVGLLTTEGLSVNDVVRQWNYIPNILKIAQQDGKKLQHYQIFNEVRRHYYNLYRSIQGYPAATGIGVSTGSVSIDICAISSLDQTEIYSVNNPQQVNAYQYQQDVLIGELIKGTQVKQAPQFERAKLVSLANKNTLFVSGTASIKGQYTIGINDVEAQTLTTLELISQLIQEAPNVNNALKSLEQKVDYARIYVKNTEDFDAIKTICKKQLKDTTLCFVQADVCRDNLLVEIECEVSYTSTNSSLNMVDSECIKVEQGI